MGLDLIALSICVCLYGMGTVGTVLGILMKSQYITAISVSVTFVTNFLMIMLYYSFTTLQKILDNLNLPSTIIGG